MTTNAEYAERRQRWLTALRSAEYKQARLRLYDPTTGGYCCLGVACAIFSEELSIVKSSIEDTSDPIITYDGEAALLPASVQKHLGLRTSDGEISIDNSLTMLNDGGRPFSEIADIIERNTVSLFREGTL